MPYEHRKIEPDSNSIIALPDGFKWGVTEDQEEIVIDKLPPDFYDEDYKELNERITRLEERMDSRQKQRDTRVGAAILLASAIVSVLLIIFIVVTVL